MKNRLSQRKNLVLMHYFIGSFSFCRVNLVLKKYILLLSLILLCSCSMAEIRNGYEKDVSQMRASLRRQRALLEVNYRLTPHQRRKIEHKIDSLVENISNYELTENLLGQFKSIAPDLYTEIDTLKDIKGRSVKVYVKFIPVDGTAVKAWGTTYMSEMKNDKDIFCSEYGINTVSVKIWIVNKALFVLAHELGHVRYQVLHFAKYMAFYKTNYTAQVHPTTNLGHNSNDLSGRSASAYVKRFRKAFVSYLRSNKEKVQPPLVVINIIKRTLTDDGNLL